jgi:hypothetical protein
MKLGWAGWLAGWLGIASSCSDIVDFARHLDGWEVFKYVSGGQVPAKSSLDVGGKKVALGKMR